MFPFPDPPACPARAMKISRPRRARCYAAARVVTRR